MDLGLSGKRALVTGASGGIGGAIAKALAAQGAILALSGTRVEPLEALRKELGEKHQVVPCDLSNPAEVDGLVKKAEGARLHSVKLPALGSGGSADVELAFVHNRSPGRLAGLPASLVLDDLAGIAARAPDLVVETAHPLYTRDFGEAILAVADYMPVSVTALADDALRERLVAAAMRSGHRLLVPHGALMGTDNLVERRDAWAEVEITYTTSCWSCSRPSWGRWWWPARGPRSPRT